MKTLPTISINSCIANNYNLQENKNTNPITNNFNNSFRFSRVTPSMRGINISTVQADKKLMRDIISVYKYGKDSLINNPQGVKIHADKKNFYIDNFYTPKSSEGICEELAYKAGKKLEERFGDKYIFKAAGGKCQKYQLSHMFVIGFKNTESNRKITDSLCSLYNETITLISTKGHTEEVYSAIEEKQKRLIPMKYDLLKGAILIDPSFGIVEEFDKNCNVNGYSWNTNLTNFEDMNPFKTSALIRPKALLATTGLQLPMGYARNIVPELELPYDTMLGLFANPIFDDLYCGFFYLSENDSRAKILPPNASPKLRNFLYSISN